MSGKRSRKGWLWALIVVAVILAGGALGLRYALQTPNGRAAYNVVEYRLRALWIDWFGEPEPDESPGGAIGGIVRDEAGQPQAGAVVLVATLRGVVHQAHSDEYGSYQIENVPPGRYVPVAGKWGYDDALYYRGSEERTPVHVQSGKLTANVDLVLRQHTPWQAAIDEPPLLGPDQTGAALFPSEVYARRVPITFTNEGLVITTTLLYEPLEIGQGESLPVIVASYPSAPIDWDRVSVALAAEGYVVLATGPSPQRALDIHGMGRDLLKAVSYLHHGQLTDRADVEREGWLAGSFSSLILYRAMLEDPGGIDALVSVGGISDAFLMLQALYDVGLEIPPRYAAAIAALGRADRYPEVYLGYSAAFHAVHMPPALVVHTTADEVIPYNQSLRFADALSAAGVTHELFLYEDTTHYLDQVNVTPDTAELYRRLSAFLDQYVRKSAH